MCYTLPKIWMGRIQKYWDRIIPSDYPASGSTFSTKFKSDEAAVAVEKMENEIHTENCVAINAIPENTYVFLIQTEINVANTECYYENKEGLH